MSLGKFVKKTFHKTTYIEQKIIEKGLPFHNLAITTAINISALHLTYCSFTSVFEKFRWEKGTNVREMRVFSERDPST